MQTNDPIEDGILDPKFTAYQREMARLFRIHPSQFPAEEPPLPNVNPTGFKRMAPPISQPPAPTPAEQAAAIAAIYGVHAQFVSTAPFEDEQAAAAAVVLDARRLARRTEIAQKYGVLPQNLHHIPLEWLDS